MPLFYISLSLRRFSSHEHEMLIVSYCDRMMSVVRPAASTICYIQLPFEAAGPIFIRLRRQVPRFVLYQNYPNRFAPLHNKSVIAKTKNFKRHLFYNHWAYFNQTL